MEQKKETKKQIAATCDTCIHHVYDEIFACETCELSLDEDEFLRYAQFTYVSRPCPFYQFADEYINVRKQI